MLTPGYALTATERILPSMALDFTTGVLDPRVTFTRALNTATRTNASGLIEVVNANLPRFDYDPVTFAPRGLLVEESRSNLLPYSEDLTNGVWFTSNITLTSSSNTSPSGGLEYLCTPTAAGYVLRVTTTAAATTYTLTCYVRPSGTLSNLSFGAYAGADTAIVTFNVLTGVASSPVSSGTGTIISYSAVPAGNGRYRCSITFNGVTNANLTLTPVYNATQTGGIYLWGVQLEAGSAVTSYIPTTTTSLTRNADAVSMTGTNFSDWFNASEGTLLANGSWNGSASATALFAVISNGGNSNRMLLYANNSAADAQFTVFDGGTPQADIGGLGVTLAGEVFKAAGAYKANNFAAIGKSGSVSTDTSGTVPSVNVLHLGSNLGSSNFLKGYIRQISYWKHRITNAEMQAFTKL